jgi:folate-binding protein YgfZ
MTNITQLPSRGVIALTGADRVEFLNGLVSNDVALAAPGRAVWAAMLSPQGRYFIDFFIFYDGDRLLLDTPLAAIPVLITKLRRYRLRMAVEITDLSDALSVYAAWGGMPPEIPVTAPDPRLAEAGYRLISAPGAPESATETDYNALRLGLGLPDGPLDLEPDKTLLLEAGFDELNGVSWTKGCYMGQELTARTKYRGLIKRRLVPVVLDGALAPAGEPILAEGVEVGTLRSGLGTLALATLRLNALNKPLLAGNALLKPFFPTWMKLPA